MPSRKTAVQVIDGIAAKARQTPAPGRALTYQDIKDAVARLTQAAPLLEESLEEWRRTHITETLPVRDDDG